MRATPAFDASAPCRYRSPFARWDVEATVFAGSWRRHRFAYDDDGHFWRPDHVSLLRAEVFKAPSPTLLRRLEIIELLLHTRFTSALEHGPVGEICLALAEGRLLSWSSPQMREDAHRMVVDESFHGWFSAAVSNDVCVKTGVQCLGGQSSLPARLGALLETFDSRYRELIKLFFVICSETLITGTLNTGARSDELQAPIRYMLEDHASDESFHRSYFIQCCRETWTRLTAGERDLVIAALPAMLHSYLQPDAVSVSGMLQSLPGLAGIPDITMEVTTHPSIAASTRAASRTTVQMFGTLAPGLLHRIGEHLDALGLWVGPVDDAPSAG